ncbi:Anoctamin-6 [Phytophthora cinnamomi]|uniref:Anoctamin-6 n=1 Tax=Phytophthora cinnamomi TaxID=4785 RepID=UPI00355ABAE2|nr:Anoctamin-6 [Phytophthora cinnamomi]
MGTREGASAGRKPWRYYYVMALPLGGGSGTTQDKLQEITEMTAAIEQREEEYLHKVAAKNAAHAAAVEAERKAVEGKQKPPMSSYVAWVLRRLHATSVVVLVAAIGVLYVWYKHDDGRDHVPPSLKESKQVVRSTSK